jgi:hypothetical protein
MSTRTSLPFSVSLRFATIDEVPTVTTAGTVEAGIDGCTVAQPTTSSAQTLELAIACTGAEVLLCDAVRGTTLARGYGSLTHLTAFTADLTFEVELYRNGRIGRYLVRARKPYPKDKIAIPPSLRAGPAAGF